MKDLTLSALTVLLVALAIGLAFHAAYPRVEPSGELATLFVFFAIVLRLLVTKAWAALRRRPPPATPEAKE